MIRLFNKNKGSLTVEACIIMPIFISMILIVLLFMKVIFVNGFIQHILNDVTNEIGTYTYIYSATGIEEQDQNAKKYLEENRKAFDEHFKDGVDAFSSLSDNSKNLTFNIDDIKNRISASQGDAKVLEEIFSE